MLPRACGVLRMDQTAHMPSIVYGDAPAPVWQRPWHKSKFGVDGFRVIADLQPGQHWSMAPIEPNLYEALVDVENGPAPVGVAIAADLFREGAEWAFSTEMYLNRPLT